MIRSGYDFHFELFRYFLLDKLNKYDSEYDDYLQELPRKLKDRNPDEVVAELKKWSLENSNPRVQIAKYLNKKLKDFNLKIDEEWAKGGILIKNLQNGDISLEGLSTGTKQTLLTAIVLYLLETKNKTILFDEPENSLFPDIQRTLINYYTELAPEAQFFFATHSPLIASQFEPCERFILSFDEKGNIQARNGTAPQGDDPNDLLVKDFGLVSLLGEQGLAAFERFIDLKKLIRNEKDLVQNDRLMNEYLTLQREYNF